jgi:chorismate mutase
VASCSGTTTRSAAPILVAVASLFLVGCAGAPPATSHASAAPPALARLLNLMRARLVLMHDVARSKWNADRPVGDSERERALLREMEEQGQRHGLDPEFTSAFFAAQITAARLVQEDDLTRWRDEKRGPFEDAPDLGELRRRIDGLNRELLDALAEARPRLGDATTQEHLRRWAHDVLTGDGITDDVCSAAIAPLVAP